MHCFSTRPPTRSRQVANKGRPPLPNDEQIAEMVIDLAKEISLSESQEAEVSELYFAHFEEVEAFTKNNKGERGANQEAMEELRAGLEKNVKALLTEERQEQLDAFQEKNRPQRGRGGRPPGRG
ncbi:MAG: hypothetical protein AAFZ15_20265 [Bacteroidota bacterium]